MQRVCVEPCERLEGEINISGAKNSVLKIMAATVLAQGEYRLHNVPGISDVYDMAELLRYMGMHVTFEEQGTLVIVHDGELRTEAPYELVEKMRASINVLGPLVARYGKATIALPGGDDFGPRPVDMHVRALEQLGATCKSAHGYVEVTANKLVGARIVLEFPSVGATENALTAAVLSEGTTIIDNAAREPEIADLAAFLNRMGAIVLGAGSSTLQIEGVKELHSVSHEIIPDRIESATFLAALGIVSGEITLRGARSQHMDMFQEKCTQMGMKISSTPDGIWASMENRLRSVDIATLPYPGVATDYKPMLVAMLTTADGVSIVTENLFHGRFRYIDEFVRMGADIRYEGHHAVIRGVPRLSSAPVRAHDIRAGAALTIAALKADGKTIIADAHHISRGYENFVGKLAGVGANIYEETV